VRAGPSCYVTIRQFELGVKSSTLHHISTGLALHLEIQLQKRQKDIHPAQTVAMRRKGKKNQRKRASGQFHLVGKATRKCSPKDRYNTYIEKMILGVIRQCHMTSASKFRPQQTQVSYLLQPRPGGRRSFDSWQVGVSIDSLLEYGRLF
jgi:hypothetical protein